jgi:hypothetical protein
VRVPMVVALCALSGVMAVGLAARPTRPQEGKKSMVEAANRFLKSLESEQRAKTVFPFDSEERLNWFFVPRERQGLTFKAMSEPQRAAAVELLKAALSAKGYQRVETIRQLENILREIEQGRGPIRDPELYYFTIFGTPSDKEPWALRYEGHHVSLHWTFIDGKVVASTPQFFGSNPGEVRDGPMKGTRIMAEEEDMARGLLKSLDENQRRLAILSDKAPADILTNNQRQAAIQEDKGIAYSQLSKPQQGMLLALIRQNAVAQRPEVAKQRMDRLTKAGLAGIKFAWMGGIERGEPHYYRIQGPTFLIEMDNTQNNANHVHLVWRDFKGDFGTDMLAEHYKHAPHNHGHDH